MCDVCSQTKQTFKAMKQVVIRTVLILMVGMWSCTESNLLVDPASLPDVNTVLGDLTIADAKRWYSSRQTVNSNNRLQPNQDKEKLHLEQVMDWSKAREHRTARNATWVIVPLQAKKGERVSHVWSSGLSSQNDQRGLSSYTYQAFLKDKSGKIQTYIFKSLPSVENFKKNHEKAKKGQFDGILLGFDEGGKFIEGVKYDNGRITGATTSLSRVSSEKPSPTGRLASCISYSVTVFWRICVEYQGQDICVSGSDTYSSSFCTNPTFYQMADAPPQEDGSGGGGGSSEPEDLSMIEDMAVAGPDKPINDVRKYLRCFDDNPNDKYKLTVYVDQPVANSTDYMNSTAAYGHKVGHTYLGLTQQGPNNSYVNRVVGWYPAQGGSPFNPQGPGTLGQDDTYTGGYDVSVTFTVSQGQFTSVLRYISDHAPGNYNLNEFNCMDFALGAMQAAGINLPDNYTQWPLGGGSNPGRLGQDLRNMSLPAGATRQTSHGQPEQNSSECN